MHTRYPGLTHLHSVSYTRITAFRRGYSCHKKFQSARMYKNIIRLLVFVCAWTTILIVYWLKQILTPIPLGTIHDIN